MEKNTRGFTLIELLVVISIISLLSSIVMSTLSAAKDKGSDTKSIQTVIQTRNALQMYFADNGNYPATLSELTTPKTYISTIDPAVKYEVVGNNNYHMAIILKQAMGVLSSDADTNTTLIKGNSTDCAGANTGTDLCYDVTAQ
ncbi:MAG: prepilin-type N-terminal cleavage/methylation domain-containing protein [bacterium]